jgi:hypothetical protein
MGDDNQTPGQQAQSDEPFFSIAEAVVFECDARPGKHLFGILEAEAMLGDVLSGSSPRPIRISFPSHLTATLFVVTGKPGLVFKH